MKLGHGSMHRQIAPKVKPRRYFGAAAAFQP
jgi:hypothetical protein